MNLSLKKYFKHFLEIFAVSIIYISSRILGYRRGSDFIGAFFKFAGPKIRRRKKIAYKNLDIIFHNTKTDQEKSEIVKSMWNNWGRTTADYCNLNYIYKNFDEFITVRGLENLYKNAIYVSAHYSNFEAGVLSLVKHDIDLVQLYRRASNELFNKVGLYTQKHIPKTLVDRSDEGMRRIIKAIKDKQSVFMLVDQNMNTGISCDFFGEHAMTAKGPAVLALKYGVPIIPVRVNRVNKYYFNVEIENPINTTKFTTVHEITAEINKKFESWISENPDEWLLIHNRWKKV